MPRKAPDFKLPDQDGIIRSLKDYRGRWLVLYFYPHDRTLNCTREACHFRDERKAINQFGNAEVIGINKAPVASHKRFAEKHHLNFPILSDAAHKVTSAYGAWRTNTATIFDRPFGTRRNTYLIDPEGNIRKEYLNVDPNTHAQDIIVDLQQLQAIT